MITSLLYRTILLRFLFRSLDRGHVLYSLNCLISFSCCTFLCLIFTRKLFMDPEKLLALIHHTDQTAEARIFRFEQGVEFAQGGAVGAGGDAMFEISGVCLAHELGEV